MVVVGTAMTMPPPEIRGRADAHLTTSLGRCDRGVSSPGEVDVFEDAQGASWRVREPPAVQPAVVDADHLPRLHVADERRADDVQRAGLGGDDETVGQAPDRQRAETPADRAPRRRFARP